MKREMIISEFREFHGLYHDLFKRSDSREQSEKYLRGLLSPAERKNGWQISEITGNKVPDPTQRLLYRTEWDQDRARDILQDYVVKHFGAAGGIGILDETGFLKKGKSSVGVQRQYTGTAGKVENCQIGVFLVYSTSHGYSFLDRRLYIPESWCDDPARRNRARIPDSVQFQTKPQLAMEMLAYAFENDIPMEWITGDEVYGNSSELRSMLKNRGKKYVVAVKSNLHVKLSLESDSISVASIATKIRANGWKRFSVGRGEKGERVYDWARVRIFEKLDDKWSEGWLLVRRSTLKPDELAYYLSNAPRETTLKKLAGIAAARFRIEQCFEEAKGETGLDQYEARLWQCWYRHITLSMMAHTFLSVLRLKNGGKKKSLLTSIWQN